MKIKRYNSIGSEELTAAKKVIKNGILSDFVGSNSKKFLGGKYVQKFENQITKYFRVKYAITTNSWTSGLIAALGSMNLQPGDEVICTPWTMSACASSILHWNAIPVFVDIDKDNFGICPSKIQEAITKKTRAIIYIDYGGIPANYSEIKKIAKKNNLFLINDAAQSLGSMINDKNLGALGDISTMSFHMAKILTTIEGGMIFTNNKKLKLKIETLRNIGEPKNNKYKHHLIGTNARMTEINAAIGLEQLNKLDFFIKRRNEVADAYIKNIKKLKIPIVLPKIQKNIKCSYFFFPILLDKRDLVAKKLKDNYNIDTRVAYPMPLYNQKVYKEGLAKSRKLNCPQSESFCKRILNLPIYPSLKNKDIDYVVQSLHTIVNSI